MRIILQLVDSTYVKIIYPKKIKYYEDMGRPSLIKTLRKIATSKSGYYIVRLEDSFFNGSFLVNLRYITHSSSYSMGDILGDTHAFPCASFLNKNIFYSGSTLNKNIFYSGSTTLEELPTKLFVNVIPIEKNFFTSLFLKMKGFQIE